VTIECDNASDEELARQCQAGSLDAFEVLVSRYECRIYGFVLNSCHHIVDAREITQDTFVRAFQALAQFDSKQVFAAWLFAIAHRKCIDRHRTQRPVVDEPGAELPDFNDPAELLARKEAGSALWQLARQRLSEIQFQALWLKYTEEMNVADIARVLHKTQSHVKVVLFRARKILAGDPEILKMEPQVATRPLFSVPASPKNEQHEILAHTIENL
jgi:RNA polymerase sigma-70 factor (ECF subfamily)